MLPFGDRLDRLAAALGVPAEWIVSGNRGTQDLLAELTPARAPGDFLTTAEHRQQKIAAAAAKEADRVAASAARERKSAKLRAAQQVCYSCGEKGGLILQGLCDDCWIS